MTPEEKAIELTKKMGYAAGTYINDLVLDIAKRSALVCVDEIICILVDNKNFTKGVDEFSIQITYWQEVKTHIQSI